MKKFLALFLFLAMATLAHAQGTTASLAGTVKDSSGAVIPKAKVTVTTPTLVGTKTFISDGKGAYHFENLPPGSYTVTVEAPGFSTRKQEHVILEVGHSPTLDLSLAVGSKETVVDVDSDSGPMIDVTSVTTQTNITKDVIDYIPRGTSFQSVIQFAPAASNEPLMGNTMTNGSGSVSPGNGSNGQQYGYSIAGGADSENSYLVEGQETANLIGGYSHTNVPFDFIQEVQIVTSGVEAEHGGALGGVVNVIMKKGSSHIHGSLFAQFENQSLDSTPSNTIEYNPQLTPTDQPGWVTPAAGIYNCDSTLANPMNCYTAQSDTPIANYQPKKAHYSDVFPGFTLGGPLAEFLPKLSHIKPSWNDKLFFFMAFNPQMLRTETHVNYNAASSANPGLGNVGFSQNTNTYYGVARIDAQVTSKIRVFGSWLYQFQHQNGELLPGMDSTTGIQNSATAQAPSNFAHTLGYAAPNTTWNTGADITVTPSLVSTTRLGYYFENYHDFGYPTGGTVYQFQTNGIGATNALGTPIDAAYSQAQYYQSGPLNNLTAYNSNKAIELYQTFAYYQTGLFGSHNFRFGYQLNRDSNKISQSYNEPYVQIFAGNSKQTQYSPGSSVGMANCAAGIAARPQILYGTAASCQGLDGYALLYDIGTGGKAISYNNGFFAQDSWTVGHGLTLDLGVRIEKENLPGEVTASGVPANPIQFGWGDKIAPRLGAAYDVFQNGKLKVFGSYGVFNDQMKLNLAISSFGGQYWNNCAYALGAGSSPGAIDASFDANRRYCQGTDPSVGGNFANGVTPAGLTFLENENQRESTITCTTCNAYEEGVAPNLKPYRQHADVAGVDYQLTKTYSLEARYDRRRLDHVIEDSAVFANGSETFVIVNPGQGVDDTFKDFCNFLYSKSPGGSSVACASPAYPPNGAIAAARSYDGVEVRINKAYSDHWSGLFSYTYSHFRGNYTGLTSSDISDGGTGGRNAPNNSRAFDEPYFQFNDNGGSSSGLLPTDRPNKLKGYVYYKLDYLHKFNTTFGLFQTAYEGSPNTSYTSIGYEENAFFQNVVNRGKWIDVTQNQGTGAITISNPRTYRNPWYNQTDFSVQESYKLSGSKSVSFQATAMNILNQHTVTAVNEQIDSPYGGGSYFGIPNGYYIGDGIPFYAASMDKYNLSSVLNGATAPANPDGFSAQNDANGPESISSLYGKPLSYQIPRKIRLQVNFSF
jgi:outer membrane receptor protein involved in Fe transport